MRNMVLHSAHNHNTMAVSVKLLFATALCQAIVASARNNTDTSNDSSEAQLSLSSAGDIASEGVKQDYTAAAEWISKAAEQGDGEAQLILGSMYAEGVGVKQVSLKAAARYPKASEQGACAVLKTS